MIRPESNRLRDCKLRYATYGTVPVPTPSKVEKRLDAWQTRGPACPSWNFSNMPCRLDGSELSYGAAAGVVMTILETGWVTDLESWERER